MGSYISPNLALDDSTIYASQSDIYALDIQNGVLRYQQHVPGVHYLSVGNNVFYLNTNNGSNSLVQAFTSHNGSLLWSYQVKGHLAQAPVVINNIVYVSVVEGSIYALQASTGTLLWHSTIDLGPNIPSYLGPIVFTAPLVIDTMVYLVPAVNDPLKPFLYSFETKDGQLVRKTQLSGGSLFPLVIQHDTLYYSTTDGCSAVQVTDGTVFWKWEPGGTSQLYSSPIIYKGVGFVIGSTLRTEYVSSIPGEVKYSWQTFISALRVSDGSLLWQRFLDDTSSENRPMELTMIDKILYISTNHGILFAYQPDDGHMLWRYQTKGNFLSSPIGAQGNVYIGDDIGSIYALRVSDKKLLWETSIPMNITSTATISSENISENP